jgi:NAD(P)-dependent dehydrogenase (short-subunit alcohol dehydrogenase family)
MGSEFDNKVAVVTGASSGVGAATAILLAARGAKVVLVGRHKSHLGATAKAIKTGGGSSLTVVTDLCDDGAPEKVRKAVIRAYGSVDVLVHCAGLLEKGALEDVDVESIDRMWRINARAPMLLTKALIPHLSEGSAIVFVSSTVAHTGFPAYAPYTATKGAVEALNRSLAVELAPRTRVNVVAPGFISTPMLTDQYPEAPQMEPWILGLTPLGFIASAQDIAGTIVALADPSTSRYITGTTLVCDGGWLARL